MKKKNKLKTDIIEKYISAVIAYDVAYDEYREYEQDLNDQDIRQSIELETMRNHYIKLSGEKEGLKELLRKYYTKYEIGLFTDAAAYRHKLNCEMREFYEAQTYDDLDEDCDGNDQCDEASEEDSTDESVRGEQVDDMNDEVKGGVI